jgi:integrase
MADSCRLRPCVTFTRCCAPCWSRESGLGWLPNNPAMRATPPRLDRRPVTPPAPEHVLRLIDAAAPDLACYLRLAAVTGARRGEICALRWNDLDLAEGTIAISRAVVGRRNDTVAVKTTKDGSRSPHRGRRCDRRIADRSSASVRRASCRMWCGARCRCVRVLRGRRRRTTLAPRRDNAGVRAIAARTWAQQRSSARSASCRRDADARSRRPSIHRCRPPGTCEPRHDAERLRSLGAGIRPGCSGGPR